ncbi:Leucine-rich repeat containing protein [Entamoeba marina]
MNLLNKVYLANVILYVSSVKCITQLILVNKKCKDAVNIVKINPIFKTTEEHPKSIIEHIINFNKTLLLFPKLQSIIMTKHTINSIDVLSTTNHLLIFPSMNIFTLLNFDDWYERIIELTIKDNDNSISLSLFPLLRRIKLTTQNDSNLHEFFDSKQQHLYYVKICLKTMITQTKLHYLKNCFIETLVIFTTSFSKQTVCYFNNFNRASINNSCSTQEHLFLPNKNVFLIEDVNENQLLQYYPTTVLLRGIRDIDISQFEFIQSVHQYKEIGNIKLPTQLTFLKDYHFTNTYPYLRSLELSKTIYPITLPTTVTKLLLHSCSSIVYNCCYLIELEVHQHLVIDIETCLSLKLLTLFEVKLNTSTIALPHLQHLQLLFCSTNHDIQYSTSIQYLCCDQHFIFNHTHIRKLELVTCETLTNLNEMNCLKELTIHHSKQRVYLPSSLLILNIYYSTDETIFESEANLKEVTICFSENIQLNIRTIHKISLLNSTLNTKSDEYSQIVMYSTND